MFDPNEFVGFCRSAITGSHPEATIAAELHRIVSDPSSIEAPSPTARDRRVLHRSSDLTVLHTSYPAAFRTPPHDHGTWAVVSVYGGLETNVIYERSGASLVELERRTIAAGEVVVLSPDTIHDLSTAPDTTTNSIHVYGGELFSPEHSMWLPPDLTEPAFHQPAFRAASDEMVRRARRGPTGQG